MKVMLTIPVYNEQTYVTQVLTEVRKYIPDVLVVDDGSTDDTPLLLARQPVDVIRHAVNRGYGRSMIDAFRWAGCGALGYDWLITMDCDLQHEPASLPAFLSAIEAAGDEGADVVSGSRYLLTQLQADRPPAERLAINTAITALVNERLGLNLTDAFCGFKAYRVRALRQLKLSEPGYAFPLQFWVQAAANDFKIAELPIRLIYHDATRNFGGRLDKSDLRLRHYRMVFQRELARFPEKFAAAPAGAAPSDGERSASARCAP